MIGLGIGLSAAPAPMRAATLAIDGVTQVEAEGDVVIHYTVEEDQVVEAALFEASRPAPAPSDFGRTAGAYAALGALDLTMSGGTPLSVPADLDGPHRLALLLEGAIHVSAPFTLVERTDVVASVGTVSDIVCQPDGAVTFTLSGSANAAADGTHTMSVADQARGAKWLAAPTLAEGPAGTFTPRGDGVYIHVGEAPVVTRSWQRGGTIPVSTQAAYALASPTDDNRQIDYVLSLFTATGDRVAVRTVAQAEIAYTPQVVRTEARVQADTSALPASDRVVAMYWMRLPSVAGFRFGLRDGDGEIAISIQNGRVDRGWIGDAGDPPADSFPSGIGGGRTDGIASDGDWLFVALHGKPSGAHQVYASVNGGALVPGNLRTNTRSPRDWLYQHPDLTLYSAAAGNNPLNADIARMVLAIPDPGLDLEAPGTLGQLLVAGTGLPKNPVLNADLWDDLLIDDRLSAAERAQGKHAGTLPDLTVLSGTHMQVAA